MGSKGGRVYDKPESACVEGKSTFDDCLGYREKKSFEFRDSIEVGIQSRKDNGGKIFGSNESVGLIATSAESDYQIKKNESVVAAIDLAAIDRYRVYP